MNKTAKIIVAGVATNLLLNVGLLVVKRSGGSAAGSVYEVVGRLASAAKFALTPAPVSFIEMLADAREEQPAASQRHLRMVV